MNLKRRPGKSLWTLVLGILATAMPVDDDIIGFSGLLTQSTQDGTGPALNNPSLNGIADGDPYSVALDSSGAVTGIGAFDPLQGALLTFSDGSISEAGFGVVYLNVSLDANPSLYDVSLLACLTTGSGCFNGNSLSVNFSVSAASFNSANAAAAFIPGLVPSLDLLEDDGVTDIQGTVTAFSNSAPSASSPEPSSFFELCLSSFVFVALWLRPTSFPSIQNRSAK